MVLDVFDILQSFRRFWGLFPCFDAIIKGCKVDVDRSYIVDPNRCFLGAFELESSWIIVASMLACIESCILSMSYHTNSFRDRIDLDRFASKDVNVSHGVVFDRTSCCYDDGDDDGAPANL